MIGRVRRAIDSLKRTLRGFGEAADEFLIGTPVVEQPPLIRNEILKLRAQSVDRLSTACFSLGAAGVAAPVLQSFVRQHGLPAKPACEPPIHLKDDVAQALKTAGVDCAMPWTNHELIALWATVVIWIFAGFLLHVIAEAFLLKMGEK
jgi:hypothetical protein